MLTSQQIQNRTSPDSPNSYRFNPRPFSDEIEQKSTGYESGSVQAKQAIYPEYNFGKISVLPQSGSVQMAAASSPTSSPAKRPTLKPGDQGAGVSCFQYYLNDKNSSDGCDPAHVPWINTDGIYGKKTTAAVFTFQHRMGLPISGVADHATRIAAGNVEDVIPTYGGGV